MSAECYPMTLLPHLSRLYLDYLALGERPAETGPLATWYAAPPAGDAWMSGTPVGSPDLAAIAAVLEQQAQSFGAGPATLSNIASLRAGAHAVVTGQQVGLFGGPLLVLHKAATAIARARQATEATGVQHVPIFWLASEDHDLAEVDQIILPAKQSLETLRLGLTSHGEPVGGITLGPEVEPLLDQLRELLSYAPECDDLAACYAPGTALASAFGRWMTQLFAPHGLVVLDAAGREAHRLGASTLRAGIERAGELEAALLERSRELETAGYHAQVLVKPGASLLFLIDDATGQRLPLRHTEGGPWKAGNRSLETAELLGILDESPERLSPNALLRPLFQDTILPTAAYLGGPAEIAYFAQSEVLYKRLFGRATPALPRFSATLLEPAMRKVMASHELSLEDLYTARTAEALTLRLGARAMPIEGKRRLAAAGNALDTELTALTGYLAALDSSLGRSAEVSASKMRYQMNRLRRMAANFETQKEASLRRHAEALMLRLLPDGHPQERVLGGIAFVAQTGPGLIDTLVEAAGRMCLGHCVLPV